MIDELYIAKFLDKKTFHYCIFMKRDLLVNTLQFIWISLKPVSLKKPRYALQPEKPHR